MSNISGTNVAASIVPFTTDDSYPTHDATYGKGGYREVETINDRDNIALSRRNKGMMVYVSETNTVYRLINETTNEYEEYISDTVKRYKSFSDLPSAGKANVIYLITDTYDIYAWNPDKIQYIQLNNIKQDIQIDKIICGDANG